MITTLTPEDFSSFNRMDYVLYEIHDFRCIPNQEYDDWKLRALTDLKSAGFVKLKDNSYVLTEDGREVIKHDSLVGYHKRISQKKSEEEEAKGFLHELVLLLGKKIWA